MTLRWAGAESAILRSPSGDLLAATGSGVRPGQAVARGGDLTGANGPVAELTVLDDGADAYLAEVHRLTGREAALSGPKDPPRLDCAVDRR